MPLSPNMFLNIPVPSQTGGPQYALDEESCFKKIDSHNHTAGQGAPIPIGALIVNSNLSMNTLSVTDLKSLQLLENAVSPGSASIYMKNGDLYWTPGGGGVSVQLTIGSAIAGAPGNITNLLPPASAVYDNPSSSFIFSSNTNTAAGMDHGPLTIRNTTVSSNGITVNAPNPLPANYSYTLPNSNPSSNSVLVVDNAGVMSYVSTTFLLPSGSIIPFAGNAAPTGWLFCQGQALDSVANPNYATLFAVIGTTYGGTGAANFNVPDTRGIFLRGAGTQTIGAETYSTTLGNYQNDATAKNGLTITDPGHNHTLYWGSAFRDSGGESVPRFDAGYENSAPNNAIGNKTTGITLNAGDSETRPANLGLNFIIKY